MVVSEHVIGFPMEPPVPHEALSFGHSCCSSCFVTPLAWPLRSSSAALTDPFSAFKTLFPWGGCWFLREQSRFATDHCRFQAAQL